MTPQEVMKNFMARLAEHGYAKLANFNAHVLDNAIASTSRFSNLQDAIDSMKADQIAAEKEAVEEILGSDYADMTMDEIDSDILDADATDYESTEISNAYLDEYNDRRTTVQRVIQERKAYIFLEKYCGIQLEKKYWYDEYDEYTSWGGEDNATGNVDTGAITGSDANITLKAGDVVFGRTLTAADLKTLAQQEGTSLSGDTLIIGTGTEKTERSVVPEIGNKYTATTSTAQNINTGSNDWLVVATSKNDTITTGGADSINAGAGNDKIIVGADYASINTGTGKDSIEISEDVNNVTIHDLTEDDVLTISGTFDVDSAQIEDTLLVVKDSTGTREIRLGNLDNAKSATVNGTTLEEWLSDAGIDLDNLKTVSTSQSARLATSSTNGGNERAPIDSDYKPKPIEQTVTTVEEPQLFTGRKAKATEEIAVDLDYVTLTDGDIYIGETKVGEISSEFPNVSTFTKNGLTIKLLGVTDDPEGGTGDIQPKTLDELTTDQKAIVAGLFKWWAKESIKINEESYGIGFESPTTMVKEMGLFFYDSQGMADALASAWSTQQNYNDGSGDGTTTSMKLSVNMNYYKGVDVDDMDGTASKESAGLLDRTLAHEFTHSVMATNIRYFMKLPDFITEGTAELTHGIDDERGGKIFEIANDAARLTQALSLNDEAQGTDAYSGGYMFMRYFARQAALQTLFAPAYSEITANVNLNDNGTYYISGDNYEETATKTAQAVKLGKASSNTYTISNAGVNQSITTSASDWKINGLMNNTSLTSGAGNDSIEIIEGTFVNSGAGNDSINLNGNDATIETGDGNDYVSVEGGIDNLIDLGADDDTLVSEEISANFIDAGDGNDSISIDLSNKNIVYSGDGDDYVKFYYNNCSENKVYLEDGNDVMDASGKYNTISAGDGDDSLYISGDANLVNLGEGNDTVYVFGTENSIYGGEGDDSIVQYSNSHGGNYFTYDEYSGKDTIRGFKSNDILLIEGEYSTQKSGSNVIVKIGEASVTLQGVASFFSIENNVEEYESDEEPLLVTGTDDDDSIENILDEATINALGGDDTIDNSGDYVLFTYTEGDGDDIIYGFNETSTLRIGDGTDTFSTELDGDDVIVTVGDSTITLVGAAELDEINIEGIDPTRIFIDDDSNAKVTLDAEVISADATERTKAITIVGNDQDNAIQGGSGNDQITGGKGDDILNGGAGSDKLWGGNDDDTLLGDTGNDTLYGGAGKDLFVYSAGKDFIADYAAGDTISLGAAISKATLSGSDVVFTIGTGSLTIKNGKDKTLSLIDSTGKELSTVISGDGLVLTNTANSRVTLGSDVEKADASTRTKAIVIVGNALDNTISGGKSGDQITGGNGADSINGNSGNDKIWGGNGNDTILGSAGADNLSGGAGADKLYGGSGNDTLTGGTGNDLLWGNAGADTFVYADGDGKDIIYGFDDDDMLQITGKFTPLYVASNNSISFKVGSTYNAIVLKNYTAETFNVNGDTYALSNGKLLKQ